MTLPNSILAFDDCIKMMDEALADESGIRVSVESYNEAIYLRNRINYARRLHRQENEKVYPPDHVMHGKSDYDRLIIRVRNISGYFYVDLERNDEIRHSFQKLSEIKDQAGERS